MIKKTIKIIILIFIFTAINAFAEQKEYFYSNSAESIKDADLLNNIDFLSEADGIRVLPTEKWSTDRLWGYASFSKAKPDECKRYVYCRFRIKASAPDKSVLKLCTNTNAPVGGDFNKFLQADKWSDICVICDTQENTAAVFADGADKTGKTATKYLSGGKNELRFYADIQENEKVYIKYLTIGEASDLSEIQTVSDFSSIGADNEAGDYTYFSSNEVTINASNAAALYNNFSANANGNTFEFPRLDYKNPKRNKWITIKKTNNNDCSFTIGLKRSEYTKNPDKKYRNISISGQVWIESAYSLYTDLINIKSGDYSQTILKINSDLSVNDTSYIMQSNKWVSYEAFVNFANHTSDIYIDGNYLCSAGLDENISYADSVSFKMYGGTGAEYIQNLYVKGTVLPPDGRKAQRTSIYPTDKAVTDFLKNKTAFHQSGLGYINGKKIKLKNRPFYDSSKNDLYVSIDDINEAFNINLDEKGEFVYTDNMTVSKNEIVLNGHAAAAEGILAEKNNIKYLAVSEFSNKVLNKCCFVFKTGVAVVSDSFFEIPSGGWEYFFAREDSAISLLNEIDFLNNYMQYERPDKNKISEDFYNADASHPRLIVNKNGFNALKNMYNSDKSYKSTADKIIAQADLFMQQPLTYNYDDNLRTLSTANSAKDRMLCYGFAYRITGDTKYAEAAYSDILSLSEFPDFNTSHIIDTATYTFASAIAYDWLYDGFTDEQRKKAEMLCRRCADDLSEGYYGGIVGTALRTTGGWSAFKEGSNYNSIVNAGAICAAAALLDTDTEKYSEIISLGLRGIEYSLMNFAPMGGWDESVGYWNYVMEFLLYALKTVDTSFGTMYNLDAAMGLSDTLKFAEGCIGVDGIYNFHDGASGNFNSLSSFLCLDDIFKDEYAAALRLHDLNYSLAEPGIFDVLFYKKSEALPDKNTSCYIKGTELFSVSDKSKTCGGNFYFAAHFGTTSGYHQHSDCGSFVLDINGERFAEDLGGDNYSLQNESGYSQSMLYRYREEGHNMMVINPSYDLSLNQNAFIEAESVKHNENYDYIICNMDDAYNDADKMKLGYYVDKNNRYVLMRNEFHCSERSDVYWFMHTKAEIKIADNCAYLYKNGQWVKLMFETSGQNAQISVMDAAPLASSPNPSGQNVNEGYKKIAVHFSAEGDTVFSVKICSADYGGKIEDVPLEQWQLKDDYPTNVLDGADYTNFENSDDCIVSPFNKNVIKIANTQTSGKTEFAVPKCEKRYEIVSLGIEPVNCTVSSENILFTDENYKKNKCTIVYDKYEGSTSYVINGLKKGEINGLSDCLRLDIDGSAGSFALISDLKVTEADYFEHCESVPDLECVTAAASIHGDIIKVDGRADISDFIPKNSIVKLYADDLFKNYSASRDLNFANVLVLTDAHDSFEKCYKIDISKDEDEVCDLLCLTSKYDNFGGITLANSAMEQVSGIGGKTVGDKSLEIKAEEGNYLYYFEYSALPSNSDFTIDFLYYPDLNSNEIYCATRYNGLLSNAIPKNCFKINEWNRITLIYDFSEKSSYVYVNGDFCSKVNKEIANNTFRFLLYGDMTDKSRKFYIDDFCVYRGKISKSVLCYDKIADVFTAPIKYKSAGEYLKNISFPDGISAKIMRENGEVPGDDYAVSDGDILCISQSGVEVKRLIFKDVNCRISNLVCSEKYVSSEINCPCGEFTVYLASYGSDGRLKGAASKNYEGKERVSVDFESENFNGYMYVWSAENQKPLAKKIFINGD